MQKVNLLLFGETRILIDGKELELRNRKALALFIYLALRNAVSSRQELAVLLWPDASTEVSQTSLRNALHEIRQTPLADFLEIDRYNVKLSGEISVDVLTFRELLRQITELRCHPQYLSQDCIILMQQAVELYSDDFLANFSILNSPEFEDWQLLTRVDLQYEVTELFALLAKYYSEQSVTRSAILMLSRWIDLDPLNEEAHQLLMHNYMLSGQAERALQHYHILARQTKREFGRLPDESVQLTYRQIKNGNYGTGAKNQGWNKAVRNILPIRPNPFIGRDEDLKLLKAHLLHSGETPFALSLSGANGIGKTSLVAALVYDEDIQARFSDGILWASLGKDISANDVLRLWLDAMRISILKSSQRSEHLALQLNTGLQGKNVLLVVDNVRSTEELKIFNFSNAAHTIFITPHPYTVGLSATFQAQNALLVQALKPQARENLFDYFSPKLSQHPSHFKKLLERYGVYPSVVKAICAAYQQHLSLWGQKNLETLLDDLLEEYRLLELEVDGTSLRKNLQVYWQGIDSEIQSHLIDLLAMLDVDKSYTMLDLEKLWHNQSENLRQALNYGIVIQNESSFQVHRLLWAFLKQ